MTIIHDKKNIENIEFINYQIERNQSIAKSTILNLVAQVETCNIQNLYIIMRLCNDHDVMLNPVKFTKFSTTDVFKLQHRFLKISK